ncbi:hypothetical protein HDV62DRAFT_178604 [Trichoderma sp. SZMC 28011]
MLPTPLPPITITLTGLLLLWDFFVLDFHFSFFSGFLSLSPLPSTTFIFPTFCLPIHLPSSGLIFSSSLVLEPWLLARSLILCSSPSRADTENTVLTRTSFPWKKAIH